tara:strand:- start:762 stop:905 length:144 start_codon:yes stop_codon:yes gene_type:complete
MDRFSEELIAGIELESLEEFIIEIVENLNLLVNKINELENRIAELEN